MRKKISSQEMQISTKSNAKINENMNMNNYNNRIMQTKMISDDDVLTTSLMIKSSKKSFINEQKNKIKITHTIMKQKQFKTSKT